MLSVSTMKKIARGVKKDDMFVDYLKRSIAHSKDWPNVLSSFSLLREHMKIKYNESIVPKEVLKSLTWL